MSWALRTGGTLGSHGLKANEKTKPRSIPKAAAGTPETDDERLDPQPVIPADFRFPDPGSRG